MKRYFYAGHTIVKRGEVAMQFYDIAEFPDEVEPTTAMVEIVIEKQKKLRNKNIMLTAFNNVN